jgi:DNA-binding transcriptional regulator GbsR (MarR family)
MTYDEYLSHWRTLAPILRLTESAGVVLGALLWEGEPLAIPTIQDRAGTSYGPTWAALDLLTSRGLVAIVHPCGERKTFYRATSRRRKENVIDLLTGLKTTVGEILS